MPSGPRADFYMFNLDHRMWSPVSAAKGSVPSDRFSHGFTATLGKLYLFGGRSWIGDVDIFHHFDFDVMFSITRTFP
jgi:hypothetical protein